MVTETDRNKARSAVVSAYNSLDCVTIPFSFLHAFADAAVDAVSTDAEPGTVLKNAIRAVSEAFDPSSMLPITENQAQRRAIRSLNRLSALYAEPVKTAPAVAVKPLQWTPTAIKHTASHGVTIAIAHTEFVSYRIVEGVMGFFSVWLRLDDELPGIFDKIDDAKASAQADYDARILSAISAQVQDVAGEPLELPYKNWRGEISTRKIQPIRLELGATEWHPEPQWLLVATDVEKNADRSFALKDFNPQQTVSTVAGLESNPETLRWWCQQLLDIIENYDISHDACEEEIALLNDIRAAVDPASPASKHGDADHG